LWDDLVTAALFAFRTKSQNTLRAVSLRRTTEPCSERGVRMDLRAELEAAKQRELEQNEAARTSQRH
jgi:hypothetical protein